MKRVYVISKTHSLLWGTKKGLIQDRKGSFYCLWDILWSPNFDLYYIIQTQNTSNKKTLKHLRPLFVVLQSTNWQRWIQDMRKEAIYLLTVRRRVQRKKELWNFLTKWRGYKKSCKQTKHIIFSKWVILCTLKLDHVWHGYFDTNVPHFFRHWKYRQRRVIFNQVFNFCSLPLFFRYFFIRMKNKKWF